MPTTRGTLSLALALCLIVALAAPVLGASSAEAQAASTITIGTTDLPRSLDPGDAYDFAAWEVLSHLYTGLTRQVPGTFDYELALASDVSVSDDGLTYTFTLRDDAAFSDGTPITAGDFVTSIERARALRQGAADAIEPYVERVAADDAGRLVFTLAQPTPYFLGLVSLPPYYAVHPSLAQTSQPQPFVGSGIVGNGPYLLESYDVGQQIVLRANPDYAYGPAPLTDTIVLRSFEHSRDLRDAVQSGEVDLAWRALFQPHLDELAGAPGLTTLEVPSTRVYYLYLNQELEPTDDPLVRQALLLLLEREEAVDMVFDGHMDVLTSLVPELFPAAYAPIWPDAPDVPAAEEVLQAANYSARGSYRLAITIATSRYLYGDTFVAGIQQLLRASFRDTLFVESGTYSDTLGSNFIQVIEDGTTSVAIFGWTPIVPHPLAYLRPLVQQDEPIAASAGYGSDQLDALLAEAATTEDDSRLEAIYAQVAELLLGDHALAPLWQDHLAVVAQDGITGVQIEPNGLLHYDRLARE